MARRRSIVRVCKLAAGSLVGLVLLLAITTAVGNIVIGWENPPAGRFVETTAGRQHVLDVGPDAPVATPAPTVVLLHGATANLGDMRLALIDRLRRRYRVIAVDRPGHGWSERADGAAEASPQRQAAVLREILRKAGVERPIVLGHSWGGSVALAYALDYPQEIGGLLLLAPLAAPWRSDLRRYAEWGDTPGLGPFLAYTLAMPVAWLDMDRILWRAFAPQTAPANYVERASILLALRPAAAMANAQDLARLDSFTTALMPRYSQIATPVIVITGTRDHLISPRSQARHIASLLPHARLVLLPGVGHMLHHAEPERVIAAIDELAEGAERSRRAVEATPPP
jgi:pimeloyl-ACP methyl ester carboxylesterase